MTRRGKCTRCQDVNGVPTGVVLGGECFLCHGTGVYTRVSVDAATKAAGKRRMDAVVALREAISGMPLKQRLLIGNARIHLEDNAPERHLRMIDAVLAGRVSEVVACLRTYAESID